jgi:hypothetical protein
MRNAVGIPFMKGYLHSIGIIASVLAACSTLRVSSDYDPKANFSQYRTYAWPKEHASMAVDISGVPSGLIEQRIRSAVDAQLQVKGLRKVKDEERPDLYVYDHVTQRQKLESYGAGFGLGYGYGYGPWGVGGIASPIYNIRQYTEGTLVLDLVNAQNHQLVWRGIASDIVEEPKKSAEKIHHAVAETLKEFPPQSRTG